MRDVRSRARREIKLNALGNVAYTAVLLLLAAHATIPYGRFVFVFRQCARACDVHTCVDVKPGPFELKKRRKIESLCIL